MTGREAISAAATVLSRMNAEERAAVARVLTAPGITQEQLHADVKAIAGRAVVRRAKFGSDVERAANDLIDMLTGGLKK
jgi:hypothetical protein